MRNFACLGCSPQCSTKFKDASGLGEALATAPALEQMREIALSLSYCTITDVSGIGQMLARMPCLDKMTLNLEFNKSFSNVAGLGKLPQPMEGGRDGLWWDPEI